MSKLKADFDSAPKRFRDLFQWVCAIDAWDYCDGSLLSKLIQSENIPDEFKPIIANIISGDRPQKRKAAAKLKIPAADRMQVAAHVSLIISLLNNARLNAIQGDFIGKGAVMLGDRDGKDPLDVVKELRKESKDLILMAAKEFDVSTETIENLVRELREKIENWPNI